MIKDGFESQNQLTLTSKNNFMKTKNLLFTAMASIAFITGAYTQNVTIPDANFKAALVNNKVVSAAWLDTFKLDNWLPEQFNVVSAVQADRFKLDNWLPEQFNEVSAVQADRFKLSNWL